MSHLQKKKKERNRCDSGTGKCLASPGPQEEERGLRGLPDHSYLADGKHCREENSSVGYYQAVLFPYKFSVYVDAF